MEFGLTTIEISKYFSSAQEFRKGNANLRSELFKYMEKI